jgi:glycosyltransferase involved in cell wall biosynthesis
MLDCERMKHPHTGLYHYCYHLGKNLLDLKTQEKFCFYLPKKESKVFGSDACFVEQKSIHKLVFPRIRDTHLWHTTYQGTNYFPSGRNTKILLTVHDLNFMYETKKPEKQKKYLQKLKQKIKRANHIVVISEFVKNEIQKYFEPFENKKIEVIYNGCNIRSDIKAIRHPEVSFPFLLSIGTIAAKKNFHVLPGCLLNNDLHLVLAGIEQDKKYLEKILQEAKRLGVQKRLHYLGPVTEGEKYWLLQNCALFIFPSLAEGFGLPVIEAMHFGKPVLLSKATSLPEVGGIHASYLDHFDPRYMSQQAAIAINNHTMEKSIAIKKWADRFSWEQTAKQYMEVYKSLLYGGS